METVGLKLEFNDFQRRLPDRTTNQNYLLRLLWSMPAPKRSEEDLVFTATVVAVFTKQE